MKLASFLVVLLAWSCIVESTPLGEGNMTTGIEVTNETASSNVPINTQKKPLPTTRQSSNSNQDAVSKATPGNSWFNTTLSLPITAVAGIVVVLVFVIVVLSIIVVVNCKRLNRIKQQLKSQTVLPDSTHIPQRRSSHQLSLDNNQNSPPFIPLGAFPSSEESGQRGKHQSLKYDEPYAHQKPITDLAKNVGKSQPVAPQGACQNHERHPTPQSEWYLTASTRITNGSLSNESTPKDHEYQVPRNATKRAGLVTRDPSAKCSQTLEADESEYVVMMSEQPPMYVDDEKGVRKQRKGSKRASVKDTLRRIPENFARSKIRFFQERSSNSQKDISID